MRAIHLKFRWKEKISFFFVFVYFLSSLAAAARFFESRVPDDGNWNWNVFLIRSRFLLLARLARAVECFTRFVYNFSSLSRSPSSGQWSLYFYSFLISQAAISESSLLPGQLTSSPNCLFQFISERCDSSLRRLVKISDNSTLELHTCDHVSHVSLISCTARSHHKSLNCRRFFLSFLYIFFYLSTVSFSLFSGNFHPHDEPFWRGLRTRFLLQRWVAHAPV